MGASYVMMRPGTGGSKRFGARRSWAIPERRTEVPVCRFWLVSASNQFEDELLYVLVLSWLVTGLYLFSLVFIFISLGPWCVRPSLFLVSSVFDQTAPLSVRHLWNQRL
jgi:hypothetical protein